MLAILVGTMHPRMHSVHEYYLESCVHISSHSNGDPSSTVGKVQGTPATVPTVRERWDGQADALG